jgi:branched-chain amino acid transport system permease protein
MSRLSKTRRALQAEGRRRQLILWTAFGVVLILLPQLSTNFGLTILTQICIASVFALAYNMLLGQGGMLSFGHAVYFGLGGYFSMHVMNFIAGGWPIPVALIPLFGGAFGLLFGLIIGSFSTRRAGTVFAMISLGIAELVAGSALILVGFFGGEEGVTANRTKGPALFGYHLAQQIEVYYFAAFWFFVATYLMYRFSCTPAGRMANAVRDNPERAEFIGYSARHVRFTSFVASAFFAGLAGGMFAVQFEIVTDAAVNTVASGQVLLQAYIGGIGFFVGPIIGAIVLTLLSTIVSGATDLWLLYAGLIFLATVLFVPQGLTGLILMHAPAYKTGRLGRLAGPYLLAAIPLASVLIGVIGLLEMINFVDRAGVGDTEMRLFYSTVDTQSWLPWLEFAALVIIGAWAFQVSRPAVRSAWESANAPLAADAGTTEEQDPPISVPLREQAAE